ncbi:MAG TPA: glycoside hydrolase family 25 protein [Stellaceae bacterium]|jgi:lysozyme|nr:glycoside hydrolase family 25 protein [Stellaceae bacterium]
MIIDISHWDGTIDWDAVKASGLVDGVIIKATEGHTWVDPEFFANLRGAERVDLPYAVYHFCDANPPAAQAAHFLQLVSCLPFLALDVEANGSNTITVAQTAEIVTRLGMVRGTLPLLYINRYGPDGIGTGLPNRVLSKCQLWLPEYGTRPVPPLGWSNYTLWQYTDQGVVPGVPGDNGFCDLSRFNGDAVELAAFWATRH